LSLSTFALIACKEEPSKPLAPPVQQPLEAAKPASEGAKKLTVAPESSSVTWTMNAPLEKIYGDVPGGVSGEVFVDPTDITKTTGLVHVDLSKLVLFQQKRDDDKKEYGEKKKDDTQNKHARGWLEIDTDAPPDMLKQNQQAELKILSVTANGGADITKLTGDERKIAAVVNADFVLHGRKVQKAVDVEVTFKMNGDAVSEIRVKSLKPMMVGLEEHDVRPREAFGKLAAKGLSALGSKVATAAPVDIDIVAR